MPSVATSSGGPTARPNKAATKNRAASRPLDRLRTTGAAAMPPTGACETGLASTEARRSLRSGLLMASQHQRRRLRAGEHADAIAPGALGAVQRLVGAVDQLGHAGRAGAARVHADADRHLQLRHVVQRRADIALDAQANLLGQRASLFDA